MQMPRSYKTLLQVFYFISGTSISTILNRSKAMAYMPENILMVYWFYPIQLKEMLQGF